MPVYIYRCANHHQFERFYTVKEHDSAVSCESCDLVAQQVISPPTMVTVRASIAYDSPVDGRIITTHAARQDDLKRNNCVEYDPEMHKDAARHREERQAALESSIERDVTESIARMPDGKRRQLKQELIHQGADLQVVRDAHVDA